MKLSALNKIGAILLLAGMAAVPTRAEIVYVTAMVSNCTSTTICGSGDNQEVNPTTGYYIYKDEGGYGAYTSAKAGTTDKAIVPGSRYISNSFSNSTPDMGIMLRPHLAVPGGLYKVFHVFSSTANNVSTDIIVGFTNVENCTISWTTTDKFQRKYGQPSPQSWQLLGILTNNPGTADPAIRMYFVGGVVSAGAQARLIVEQFKFQFYEPCSDVPDVKVTGPLSVSNPNVVVTGVSNAATAITVYQDSGAGMVQIGKVTTGIVAGDNVVPVTGLVKGAKVAATQTLLGIEGCKPLAGSGIVVGGGANPRLRIALSIKENPTATGPVGWNGTNGQNSNIHFIPATNVIGGAPDGALLIYPSNTWQTITIRRGTESVGDVMNAAGAVVAGTGYNATETVDIMVYAYRTLASGTTILSTNYNMTPSVTSASSFSVNWTWDPVPGAQGYRLIRNKNYQGYDAEYRDVTSNSLADDGTGWVAGKAVTTPSYEIPFPSYEWNGTPGTLNNIAGTWGILEAISLGSDDETDSGPFDIYIDNLSNGTNGVFQDFEAFPANAVAMVFNQPSYSGTTSDKILTAPNVSEISNMASDAGTKSLHVRWQFVSGAKNNWMRFNTYHSALMPDPLVQLDEPISFRILILPVGATPNAPAAPTLNANKVGSQTVLNWVGGHRLQTSVNVTGTYTNVPQTLSGIMVNGPYNNTYLGPWTNTFTEPNRFFRLRD